MGRWLRALPDPFPTNSASSRRRICDREGAHMHELRARLRANTVAGY